jgi:hypothetical protein
VCGWRAAARSGAPGANSPKYEGKTCVNASAAAADERLRSRVSETLLVAAGVILILDSSIAAKLFTVYSHPLFPLSASGLRLETGERSDKEISEVYFARASKKILTQSLNRQVSRTSKLSAFLAG